jgi:DNA topoisomerase I
VTERRPPRCYAMKLLIVESPNKTRKIREFLGKEYRVAASFGHLRDLPTSGNLNVSFRDGQVIPRYEPLERAGAAISELQSLAKQADEVLLATDPDREGEAIAWHITQLLGAHTYRRVVFHALTRNDVLKAVATPRDLDMHLVDAQQARRVLDRVVGWLVSPTLRQLGKDARSAGRVQSVALRLVAERERDINKHNTVEYYIIQITVEKEHQPPPFTASLITWKGEPLAQRLTDRALAEKTVAWCAKQRFEVISCEQREQARHAPPPFTTATIQQAASVRLGLNPDQTMKLLQTLFENGHITYHRTDSVALAPEAIQAARAIIRERFKPAYLPAQPIIHASKSANAQEAHEAIRPTHAEHGPDHVGNTSEGKLYKLIWQRFIACQMASGRDYLTTIDIACAPGAWLVAGQPAQPMGVFQAKGKVILFDGWRKLTGGDETDEKEKSKRSKKDTANKDDDEFHGELPTVRPGEALLLRDVQAAQRATKPPPRYTQASLIKKLEKEGIGRPSTYANIMRTIIERGYVGEKARKLFATQLGLAVTDFLTRHYAGNFIDLNFTARLEDELDRIARGELAWEKLVTEASHAVLALAHQAGLRGNPLT